MIRQLRRYADRYRHGAGPYGHLFMPCEGDEVIALDCETTGLDSRTAELVSIAAVVIKDGRVLSSQGLDVKLMPPDSLKEDLESGRADLAVGLLPQLQGSFFRQRFFRQRFVCAFRQQHPLAKKKVVTKEDFYSAKHAVVVFPGTGHGEVDKLIDRKGAERKIQLTVPHFVAMGHILQETDLIATLPERLVKCLEGPFKLKGVPHPIKLPDHSIGLFWHAKLHREPANQWLRRLMFELFTD